MVFICEEVKQDGLGPLTIDSVLKTNLGFTNLKGKIRDEWVKYTANWY